MNGGSSLFGWFHNRSITIQVTLAIFLVLAVAMSLLAWHNANSSRSATAELWIAAGVAASNLVLVAWLTSRMGRRLRRVVELLQAVGAGDLTRRLEVTSTDEVGRTAAAVNAALEQLQQAHANKDDAVGQLEAIHRSHAVIEFQLDGTILTANTNFLRVMGYSLAEIRGKHHSMFVTEEHRHSTEYKEFWARLGRGEHCAGEFHGVARGGKEVGLQASYDPVLNREGKPVKVVKFASDITELMKARSEAARVQSMLEQAPLNVLFADRELKIRYLNPAVLRTLRPLEKYLPVKPENLIGQSIDLFHKNPARQRQLLGNVANLPHQATIQVGPETLDMMISPILDQNKEFIGTMATWRVVTQQLEAEQREAEATQKVRGILDHVAANATTLAGAAEEMTSVSRQLGTNADETAAQANVVSAACEEVSTNVQSVATGVEEMVASIREIAKNATEAAQVANRGVEVAESTNTIVSKLGDSSAEIGEVVKVISSIAAQTNLLALNATIEAARAGESGKGFAVVANEVKELAKDTVKATEDIRKRIEAIQIDTSTAVSAIGEIGKIIFQVNDIQNTIASAVEEQSATTSEMARNIQEAARGSTEIAENVTSVAKSAQNTTAAAGDTLHAASEMARLAAELQALTQDNTSSASGTSQKSPRDGRPSTGRARERTAAV